jgi:pilus assembly protein CpaE
MADQIVTLTTPELPALKNAARFLQVCQQSGYPQGKVLLVVNRLKSRAAVSLADIQESIHHPITLGLPSEGYRLVEAVNRGEPVVILKPRSGFSKRIAALSHLAIGNVPPPKPVKEPRPGLLKQLFSRPKAKPVEAE